MDACIWDCMNVASRIGKQIEASANLVPKSHKDVINPVSDLQELVTTVNSVRTTLVPFVTSTKKIKAVADSNFDRCVHGIKETLEELFSFFKDLEKEFSVHTWKTQKVKIYQMDFLLKQKLDQFSALFNIDEKEKKKHGNNGAAIIQDDEGREMWIKSFGESNPMVPWEVFLTTLEKYTQTSLQEDKEYIKMFLDFTRDNYVSTYEFNVFLKWFQPLRGACERMLESLRGGLLCGFIPAVEANLLLEGKKEGTFLIRFSKTQPGSFAVTFVDSMQKIKHCLLYSVDGGVTLKNPPTVYKSLKDFSESHKNKLKHPLGNKWTLKNKVHGFEYDEKLPEGIDNKGNKPAPGGLDPNSSNVCIVCMDAPFETVFLECGHLACCNDCSQKLKLCPICRNPITRIIPVYRAT